MTPTDSVRATIEPATSEEILDASSWLPRLRANFASIETSLAALSAIATSVRTLLEADPTTDDLRAAARFARFVDSRRTPAGDDLEIVASEILVFAELLAGDLVIADNGDVENAPGRGAAS